MIKYFEKWGKKSFLGHFAQIRLGRIFLKNWLMSFLDITVTYDIPKIRKN